MNKENYLAVGSNTTRIFDKSENTFWQVNYYFQKIITYIIPIILFILLSITYFVYTKKKELNETLLELSDNDFIFVFNRKGDLININKTAMKIETDSPAINRTLVVAAVAIVAGLLLTYMLFFA